MADVISAMATVAGVVSFGPRASQALATYYHAFKAHDEDVAHASEKLCSLRRILKSLKELLSENHSTDLGSTSILFDICEQILACKNGLAALETVVERLELSDTSVQLRASIHNLKQRSLYHFRKDTLKSTIQTVRDLESSLGSTLQVLLL